MLAIEKYKRSEASIERAAKIAGVSISKMMDIFKEHGVEANLEYEDYLKGMKSLRKIW
jgi:predicted HTH domain antitoxin